MQATLKSSALFYCSVTYQHISTQTTWAPHTVRQATPALLTLCCQAPTVLPLLPPAKHQPGHSAVAAAVVRKRSNASPCCCRWFLASMLALMLQLLSACLTTLAVWTGTCPHLLLLVHQQQQQQQQQTIFNKPENLGSWGLLASNIATHRHDGSCNMGTDCC